jgi:ASC-1-like (ASCH) protein
MEHLAFLNKKLKFLEEILNGHKKIESRWYQTRRMPWGKIKAGEKLYFKETGDAVKALAKISKVLEFDNLNESKVKEIVAKYGERICISQSDYKKWWNPKIKYCILIFIDKVKTIQPFNIDKAGFGNMTAWIGVEDIAKIKLDKSVKNDMF